MKKKAIIISIRPEWVAKILDEEKKLELRKTFPSKCKIPTDVYIYCTKSDKYHLDGECGIKSIKWFRWDKKTHQYQTFQETTSGKVIAKFTLSYGKEIDKYDDWLVGKSAQISSKEFYEYKGNKEVIYGWGIENPIVFEKPKELSEFGLKRPPQSWQYVEVDEDEDIKQRKSTNIS